MSSIPSLFFSKILKRFKIVIFFIYIDIVSKKRAKNLLSLMSTTLGLFETPEIYKKYPSSETTCRATMAIVGWMATRRGSQRVSPSHKWCRQLHFLASLILCRSQFRMITRKDNVKTTKQRLFHRKEPCRDICLVKINWRVYKVCTYKLLS